MPSDESLDTAALISALAASMQDGLLLLDLQGRILDVNPGFCRMTGFAREEMIGGRLPRPEWPERGQERLGSTIERHLSDGFGQYEVTLKRKDGELIHVLASSSALPDGDGLVTSHAVLVHDVSERHRTEERLRESEERYRRLVELSPDAIAVHSGGVLVYANPAAARLLGAGSAAELLGIPLLDVVHPDYHDIVAERTRREIQDGEPVPPLEEVFVRLDGSFVDVEVTGIPLNWQGRRAAQVTARDITERKRAVQQVLQAENKFRTLVEQLPAAVYIDSVVGASESIYVSPHIEEVLGFTPLEWLTDPDLWEKQLHPDDREREVRAAIAHHEKPQPYRGEYRMYTRDGELRWFLDEAVVVTDDEGRPLFCQGVMFDITDKKRLEEDGLKEATESKRVERELRHQNEALASLNDERRAAEATLRFQAQLLSKVQNALIATDAEGSVTYWNAFAESVYGWAADEAMGRSIVDLVVPKDRPGERFEGLAKALRGERWSNELEQQRRDGTTFTALVTVSPVYDEEGGVVGTVGVSLDISERKRSEQSLVAAFEREKEISQRLRDLDEMKNTFLHAVSHELRTPLATVLGFALTLERKDANLSPEDTRDIVHRMAINARKLDQLLSDLLDLDRLARGIVEPRRHPTDVGALVRRVVETSDALGERHIRVDSDLIVVALDGPKVERIVENLLANAARHTPPGTTVWVRVRGDDAGVLIAVEDEGPGIPETLRQSIFEPFQQGPNLSAHPTGVGVGLSLVAKFAELHGGRAWVEDRDGGGASFRVLLPGVRA